MVLCFEMIKRNNWSMFMTNAHSNLTVLPNNKLVVLKAKINQF